MGVGRRKALDLEAFAGRVLNLLEEKDAVREKALHACREMTRLSAAAIRKIHQDRRKEAATLLETALRLLKDTRADLQRFPEVLHAGFLHAAEKEVVEGHVFLAVISGRGFPDPEEHSFDTISFLHGLAESTGEIRRHLLDGLRKGRVRDSQRYLAVMDEIYAFLLSFHHTDAITRGLRKQVDYVRGLLERTRSDVTQAVLLDRHS